MAIIGFLFGNTPTKVSIADSLLLDAAIKIESSRQARATKNPVESGSNIADHVTLDPIILNINGFIAEDPMNFLNTLISGIGAGVIGTQVGGQFGSGFIGPATAAAAIGLNAAVNFALSPDVPSPNDATMKNRTPGDTDYPKKALTWLLGKQQQREPFQIVTDKKLYTNMVITSLSFPQEAKDGDSLFFNMRCEQVQIVSSETVKLPESVIAADAAGASSAADLGKQSTESASENTSILADIFLD